MRAVVRFHASHPHGTPSKKIRKQDHETRNSKYNFGNVPVDRAGAGWRFGTEVTYAESMAEAALRSELTLTDGGGILKVGPLIIFASPMLS